MSAATGPQPLGELLPAWSVAPFALMLLAIAVLPLAAPHSWERNRNKLLVSVVLGGPVVAGIALIDPGAVLHTAHVYAAFVILLDGVASAIGTTGASMVLIRPLLRANSVRESRSHVVVFFIFVVTNAGGLLTPLGDPPLFLGFLRGVPFLPPGRPAAARGHLGFFRYMLWSGMILVPLFVAVTFLFFR